MYLIKEKFQDLDFLSSGKNGLNALLVAMVILLQEVLHLLVIPRTMTMVHIYGLLHLI